MIGKKKSRYGRCPTCQRVQSLKVGGVVHPVMSKHSYRLPGSKKRGQCPGTGRRPVSGTEK